MVDEVLNKIDFCQIAFRFLNSYQQNNYVLNLLWFINSGVYFINIFFNNVFFWKCKIKKIRNKKSYAGPLLGIKYWKIITDKTIWSIFFDVFFMQNFQAVYNYEKMLV